MASRGAIAGIQAEALKRVEAATAAIVELLGISVPPAAPHARQADLREAYELERQADLLEQIAAATGAGNEVLKARIAQLEAFIADSELEVPEAPVVEEEPDADAADDAADPEGNADDAPDAPDGDGEPVADPPADAAGDAPVVADDYDHMTVKELQAAIQERHVEAAGASRKADLIAALRAADTAGAA